VLVLDLPPGPAPSPEAQRLLGSAAAVLAGTIDRGRAEEALRRVKDRFDLAIRGTDAGIWDWDLATGAVYFSARWKSQLGFAEDEISPHFDEWERRLHPDDRDRALSVVRAYLEGRSPEFELEHRLRHKDGSYRWILARGAASRDNRGRITRMVGCHLDITQRKRDQALHLARESRLVAARDLLAGLMPRAPLRVPGLEIHGASVAADYAQGDCFDYFRHPDGSIYALIADASGHGIDSALMMASLHARLRAYVETGLGLGPLLDRANAALVEHMSSERFITLLMLRIDPISRSLRYVNAGHPPGYILDACGRVRHELPATGIPLSITPDAGYPPSPPVLFEPGDLIVLVTDGLAETLSPSGEQFGTARVLETVRSSLDQPCPEILSRLLSAAKSFSRSSEATDDLTAVVARVLAD
jgi:PAS domain S-box-containing protein